MKYSKRVLVVDDDINFLSAISELLELLDCKVLSATTLATAKHIIAETELDHVFLDLILPDGSGLQFLSSLADRGLTNVSITIITGDSSIRNNIKSLYGPNLGYLIKPITIDNLKSVLHLEKNKRESNDYKFPKYFGTLIGESPAMHNLYQSIEKVAKTQANVLLLGESGVGKELVASAIHSESNNPGSFIAANCGAFNRELIGSEIFGHEKGAFTGAEKSKPGLFEQASGGTLLLDEITEMPIELQPTLLRVLEAKNFVRVGGTTQHQTSCRIISATNHDEESIVQNHVMRHDLFFRLAVFPIVVPPLRERADDIVLLAEYFLNEYNKESGTRISLDEESREIISSYDWPGNVRELRHVLHRGCIMSPDGETLELPKQLDKPFTTHNKKFSLEAGQSIEDVERNLIEITLKKFNGDKKLSAEVLGVSLKTLYTRLKSYDRVHTSSHNERNRVINE